MPYERHIFICTNERPPDAPKRSCRGTSLHARFKDALKKHGVPPDRVRANKSGCLDHCETGPTVVVYPDAVWYGHVTEADVDEIVASHIVRGVPVERLRLR